MSTLRINPARCRPGSRWMRPKPGVRPKTTIRACSAHERAPCAFSGITEKLHITATIRTVTRWPRSSLMIRANQPTGLRVERLDVDAESARIRSLGVIQSPTLILRCNGVERGRLVGAQSLRAVLHMVLPEIHEDPDDALMALRRQLGAPGEQFPRRVLKRHERIGKAASIERLREVPLFARMTTKQLAEVGAAADEMAVDARSIVIHTSFSD